MRLAQLHDIFGVPEEDGTNSLVRAATVVDQTLPHLVLSAVDREGRPMGPAARSELDRAVRRADQYRRLRVRLARSVPIRVLKGASIARYYPAGLLRPAKDMDLAVADEPALWRVVRWLMGEVPVEYVDVSIVDQDTRHVVATLSWPAEDPLLDPDMRVDVATAALPGDFGAVPVRAELPAHEPLADLLCLADMLLHRPVHARDIVDMWTFSTADWPPQAEVVATIARYRLAPEVVDLLDAAAAHVDPGRLAGLADALRPAADGEQARRAGHRDPGPPAGIDPVRHLLAAGRPAFGMLLRRLAPRPDWQRARLHSFDGGMLMLTPVGDYLLVDSAVVAPQRYEAALVALDALEPGDPADPTDPVASGGRPAS